MVESCFHKGVQGFPNLVRAGDADRAIDGAGRLGARWWACKSSDSYGNPMLTGLQPPFSIWSFWETAIFRITKINLQHKKNLYHQKKKHPPGCSCLLFFWGCFQHTEKGSLQNSWSWVVQTSSSSSKLPRNCFLPKSCDADRKDWVHRPPPKNPWKIPRNMGVLLTPVLKRKETWGCHGMGHFHGF